MALIEPFNTPTGVTTGGIMQVSLYRLVQGILVLCPLWASAQQYPPELPDARAEIYKTVAGEELRLWIYEPADQSQSQNRPAIVFFFGGGYRRGSPAQFENQARYLASRGMVAIVADYRVLDRHGTMVDAAVQDGEDAIKWVRDNASRLTVDPQKIAASGGSAGGHLAAMTATIGAVSETASGSATSHVPNALILFNPVLIYAPVDGHPETLDGPPRRNGPITKGLDREAFSPYQQIRSGLPPTLVFHGTADRTVPLTHIKLYAAASKAAGNRCELVTYEGADHGFFNYGRDDGSAYADTVNRMDAFLVSLGWLTPKR